MAQRNRARSYAGQTGDERAAVRRTALLDAALGLVGEHGWSQLSVEAMCREAGLNKRYFYEAFGTLDGAMAALIDEVARGVLDASLDAMPASGSPAEMTRASVRAFVTYLTEDRRRARVLLEAPPPGGAAAERRTAATRRGVALTAARGRTVFQASDPAGFELAASMVVGGTSQAVLDWLDGRVGGTREELIDGLVAMWLAIGDRMR